MGWQLLYRSLAVCLLAAATVSQEDNGQMNTGPCGEATPCTPGLKFGDPDDCLVYYQCDVTGSAYEKLSCAEGEKFDFRKLKCKDVATAAKIRCSPSCAKLNRLREKENTNPPEVQPKVEEPPTEISSTVPPDDADVTTTSVTSTVPPIVVEPIVAVMTTAETRTTTTTMTTTMATTESVQELTTAAPAATPAPPVVILPSKSAQPPYVIVTDTPTDELTVGGGAGEVGGSDDVTGSPSSGSGGINPIIIGAAVGGVLVIAIIILVVVCLVRRRKRRKDRDIEKMENPQYAKTESNSKYRFSRDSALFVGPTVNLRNNNKTPDDGLNSVERKKRHAPPAPSPAKSDKSSLKRRAPAPPNPFTGEVEDYNRPVTDLYERDSQCSDDNIEMSTFTAKNDAALPAAEAEAVATDPLLPSQDSRPVSNGKPVFRLDDIKFKDIDDSSSDEDNKNKGDVYDESKNPFAD